SLGKIIGKSQPMQALYTQLEKAAPTESTVLLLGDTGTGKEVIAETVHALSARKSKGFVIVDCGNMAPNLIESELFGHVKGAFSAQMGRADFELPEELRVKLMAYHWPGNVRELRNVIERALAGTEVDVGNDTGSKPTGPLPEDLTGLPYKDAKERLVDAFTE